jgi:hypothetical protein
MYTGTGTGIKRHYHTHTRRNCETAPVTRTRVNRTRNTAGCCGSQKLRYTVGVSRDLGRYQDSDGVLVTVLDTIALKSATTHAKKPVKLNFPIGVIDHSREREERNGFEPLSSPIDHLTIVFGQKANPGTAGCIYNGGNITWGSRLQTVFEHGKNTAVLRVGYAVVTRVG